MTLDAFYGLLARVPADQNDQQNSDLNRMQRESQMFEYLGIDDG